MVTEGVHLFSEFMGNREKVRTFFHAFGSVECREGVDPVVNLRETLVVKDIFATGFDVFHVALGYQTAFFGVDFSSLGVEFGAGQVFVHYGAKAEVIDCIRDVFARLGELGGAVAGR